MSESPNTLESEQEPDVAAEFIKQSSRERSSIGSELVAFVRQTGKWWLVPILLALIILAALAAFGSSTAGPFVYTFF